MRAQTPTLLSLERFARILGLNPLHFATAESSLMPAESECSDVWFQHTWQDPAGKVSREQLADLIYEAESDLAEALGFWPAPIWVVGEAVPYPRPYRHELLGSGADVRGRWKSVTLAWGGVQYGGRRATEELGEAEYTTVDSDGDGFSEWAVFTLAVESGLNACEVHAFFTEDDRTDPSSEGADAAWEVRDIYASVSGTTLTVRTHVWNLFLPVLHEGHGAKLIDADDADNCAEALVFYREYCDRSQQVVFLWGDDAVCVDQACAWASQDGCVRVRNSAAGVVVPIPGTWDSDTETWDPSCWAQPMEPDALWVNYYAGFVSPKGLRGCSALDDFWARNIATLACSRLTAPLCTCGSAMELVAAWREDKSLGTRERTHAVSAKTLLNPFGTKAGEEFVWKRVSPFMRGRAV